jgi:hypothetical protein
MIQPQQAADVPARLMRGYMQEDAGLLRAEH